MALDAARVKSLFLYASDLADPAVRAAYLDRECGGDAELRGRVEALLRANDAAPLPPAADEGTGPDVPDRLPQTEEHGDPTARVGSVLAGKYKLIEEIGAGGMGSVFLAQQTEPVRRAVAVKVIKAGMDTRAVLARFEAERQALAIMDHPNIARVLDAGSTDGGRPFFVMELVKGTPITVFCDERKLTPRQRLELFVPVCQAIQHAHQKGVIHRDIKPSNVLVAMYDDRPVPKVIDFGVAKAAGQTLTEKTLMTGFGAVVGTPEYMSPEQASLNNLDVDTRSDVYSLGVLLYELLTGTTPVDRKSLGQAALLEVLRIVREVEAPRPSDRLSSLDTLASVAANRATEPARLSRLMRGELDWVVLKALEKDRTRRYETANGLARDVQRYLADELVEARRPSAGYRLKKFVRRHPLELALAGAVLLLLLVGGAFAWRQHEQAQLVRQREGRNAEAVLALLDQAEGALKAGDAARAKVALEAARKRAADGGADELAGRLEGLEADLTLLRDLDAVDQFRWTPVKNDLPDYGVVKNRYWEALWRFGADPEAVSVDEAAARVSASAVRERIVSALDLLLLPKRLEDVDKFTPQLRADLAALLPKTAGVRAVLRRVDADPYRDAIRDAILAGDRAKFVVLARQQAALEQSVGFTAFLGNCWAIPIERRRQLSAAALSRQPGNLGLLMALGGTYPMNQEDGANERLRWYQAAVAAAPGNSAAHTNLGSALGDKKDHSGAEGAFRKAIELDPKYAMAHNNLGAILCNVKRDYDEAIACFKKALALDPKFAGAHFNLGNALRGKGQLDAAITCYRQALDLEPHFVQALLKQGIALYDKGQLDEAIACFKKAVALDPKFAPAHDDLGLALKGKDQLDAAIACFRRAIGLEPKNANTHYNLGIALYDKDQLDEAIACYQNAIELDPKFAKAWTNLGNALAKQGKVEEAIACHRKAIELDPKDANAHYSLGAVLHGKGKVDEVLACFKKAIELDPKHAAAHVGLGVALGIKGKVEEAITCFRTAIALDPKRAKAHWGLGIALAGKRQLDAAVECYQKAIEIDSQLAEAHIDLGHALMGCGLFAESLAAFRRGHQLGSKRKGWPYPSAEWIRQAERMAALEARLPAILTGKLQPRDTAERLGLIQVCQAKKLHHAASRLYAAAFAADPELAADVNAGHRYNAACSAALAAAGQGEDAKKLSRAERQVLRRQALTWLRGELTRWAKRLAAGEVGRSRLARLLAHWQQDTDLTAIRDKAVLGKLPAEEQKAFAHLWADVAVLLKKAGTPGPKVGKK